MCSFSSLHFLSTLLCGRLSYLCSLKLWQILLEILFKFHKWRLKLKVVEKGNYRGHMNLAFLSTHVLRTVSVSINFSISFLICFKLKILQVSACVLELRSQLPLKVMNHESAITNSLALALEITRVSICASSIPIVLSVITFHTLVKMVLSSLANVSTLWAFDATQLHLDNNFQDKRKNSNL